MEIVGEFDVAEELRKCTEKQRRYIEARASGLSAEASARIAGYSGSIDESPRVQMVLKHLAKQALKKLEITREDVLQGLLDAVHASATATELTAAWREIGKLTGAYEPEKVVHEHMHKTQEQLEAMSTDDLAALAGEEGFTLDGEFEELSDDQLLLEDLDELEYTTLDDVPEYVPAHSEE